MINFKPLLGDAGIAPATAAWIAGAVGFAVVIGRLTAGFLFDRFWAPAVAGIMLMAPAVSCLLLMPEQLTVGIALSAGLLIGLATGAEGDLMPYLTSRYFGLLHYGKTYGLLLAVFFLTSGIAPFIVGRVFDVSGSYAPALLAASVLFVVGGASLLALGPYPHRWPDAAGVREGG
jgi:OFA family oxalate/formate antiporter-like MFS transporter